MARTDNLTNFLTDIANAIRGKTGETGTIYARDFDTKISSISGGSEPEISTRLPSRYQEVEYIESIDNNNYIDTGVIFPDVKKVRYEFKVKMPSDIRGQAYWGCYMNGGYNGGTLYENRYYVAGDNVITVDLVADGIYEGYAYTDTNTKSGAFYANNGEINETLTYTSGGGLPDSDRAPFCIFCQGTPSGSGINYNNGSKLRIYYFRIYLDDVIVRDFIPCYKKEYNTIGLYDLVNDVFYANQGYGVLEKGEDVNVEVEPDNNNINVFVQEGEPESKNGLWVKTANYNSKDITVVTESGITFGESGWAPTGSYANLPQGNGYACAAELDGKMYFGGGHQNNRLFEYNMDTNVYTELPNIPYNFGWGGMNGYNGELYMFGGKHSDKTAYKYNPTTQTYTQLADIPVGFVSAVSVTLGDKIYLVTGRPWESSSTRYNTIYEYNPADNTYRLCDATIHSGDCKGATSYKGYLYIFGGDQNNRTCYRYDPRTDTAKEMKQIPFDCTDTYACATNDAIYLVGSSGSPYALWKYEPSVDSYTPLPDVPISTWGPVSGALLNKKYLFAIGDTSSSHNRVQVYTISDKTYKNTPTEGLLIDQYDKSIKTIFTNPIESYFSTVKYYSGGVEIDVEIYYGDGVNWIKL